jgi:squalene synthase HpnC
VRREGLEPTSLAAPEPKSGASTNSATFAGAYVKSGIKTTYYTAGVSVGHYENFPVASLLLPSKLRRPVKLIYRFARAADDIADEGDASADIRLERLNDYRAQLAAPREPLFRELAAMRHEFALPVSAFMDLLDAFSQDVVKKRYGNYGELLDYCRRSANPVGRLLLALFKQTTELNLRASDAICTALQLTNFWQDIEADYAKGRIYLPRDETLRFGVSERHIAEQRCDAAWHGLMAFQVERTRELFGSGKALGRALTGRIGLEIRATIQGGLRILEKIERVHYDVFRARPVLRGLDWPLLFIRAV